MQRFDRGAFLALSPPVRLGQPPPGDLLDISHTSMLRPGDVIYVEFPFFSRGRVKFGSSEAFTVVSSADEVEVADESGAPYVFQAGTQADLEAQLSDITSFSSLTVVRPGAPGPVPGTITEPWPTVVPGRPLITLEQQVLAEESYDFGVPSDYRPVAAMLVGELAPADLIYEHAWNGRRLFIVVERDDALDAVFVAIAESDVPGEARGDMSGLPSSMSVASIGVALRGPSRAPGAEYVPKSRVKVFAGAAALVAGALVLLYILK